MVCDRCKVKNATTHIKRVINGKYVEYNLCSDCAKEFGVKGIFPMFDFNDLLSGILEPEKAVISNKVCPSCGSSFEEISKHGQVGCAECYKTFYDKLIPVIQRIHGTTHHKGKSPLEKTVALSVTEDSPSKALVIQQKKEELSLAIQDQRFEEAAKLRDEIKELEVNE